MARLVTAIAVATALGCPAHAEVRRFSMTEPTPSIVDEPSIVIGTPTEGVTIDFVHVALDARDDFTRARITIALSTHARRANETQLSISVPAGSRVGNLALTLGRTRRATAVALPAFDAFVSYLRAKERSVDPALLSFERGTGIHDRFLLQVFPLVPHAPAIAELDVDVPTTSRIAVETKQVVPHLAVESVRSGSIGGSIGAELGAAVDDRTSLYVGPERRAPTVIVCGFGSSNEPMSLDTREIRREIRRHLDQLGYCYSRELQRHQRLAGTVQMRLRLVPDGTTVVESVDGDLDSEIVKSCIADQAARWRFHEHDAVIEVNYPLTFATPF